VKGEGAKRGGKKKRIRGKQRKVKKGGGKPCGGLFEPTSKKLDGSLSGRRGGEHRNEKGDIIIIGRGGGNVGVCNSRGGRKQPGGLEEEGKSEGGNATGGEKFNSMVASLYHSRKFRIRVRW